MINHTVYEELQETHLQMKKQVDLEEFRSIENTIGDINDYLQKLHRLVLQDKSETQEFHDLADIFLNRVMDLKNPDLVISYVRLALYEWNLPFKPHRMPSFVIFQKKFSSYILNDSEFQTFKPKKSISQWYWLLVGGGLLLVMYTG